MHSSVTRLWVISTCCPQCIVQRDSRGCRYGGGAGLLEPNTVHYPGRKGVTMPLVPGPARFSLVCREWGLPAPSWSWDWRAGSLSRGGTWVSWGAGSTLSLFSLVCVWEWVLLGRWYLPCCYWCHWGWLGGEAPQLISGFLTKGMDLWDALESVCPQGKESTGVLVLFSEVSPVKLFSPYPSLHLTNPPTPVWLLFLPHLETPLPFAEFLERSLVLILLTSQQPWCCEPTPPSNIFFLGFLLIPHLWVSSVDLKIHNLNVEDYVLFGG